MSRCCRPSRRHGERPDEDQAGQHHATEDDRHRGCAPSAADGPAPRGEQAAGTSDAAPGVSTRPSPPQSTSTNAPPGREWCGHLGPCSCRPGLACSWAIPLGDRASDSTPVSTSEGAPKDALEQLHVTEPRRLRPMVPAGVAGSAACVKLPTMGKKRARKQKRRRHVNTAGVAVSQTPNLDRARQWRDELHAAHGPDPEPPTAPQVADGTRVPAGEPGWRPPPPPWKVP